MPRPSSTRDLRAVTDAGPLIHLEEVEAGGALRIFEEVLLPGPVLDEVRVRPEAPGIGLATVPPVRPVDLDGDEKDLSEARGLQFDIGTNDGSVLAVAERRDVSVVLTDDLDVRDAAEALRIRPVGSFGVLLRAATTGTLDPTSVDQALVDLHERSSLFITRELVDRTRDALRTWLDEREAK